MRMRIGLRMILFSALLLTAFGVAACGGGQEATTGESPEPGEPANKGEPVVSAAK